ncbi:hypothetical protein OBV_36180 [Oscillibacter valericigenes Sjm18-20]|nr:hypothetical protein OBV_36180 [Oscillibacter valericigenes Sjm18-20]
MWYTILVVIKKAKRFPLILIDGNGFAFFESYKVDSIYAVDMNAVYSDILE